MILKYDILPGVQENYFRFVMGEFVPGLQEMGMYMHRAWHVVWGKYPERHIEFITENRDLHKFLHDPRWRELEGRLQEYITHYSCRVYRYTGTFQI
ncbi:MAG: hypothetical protein MUE40_07495 [Anaerolineae bacterium]|jgi:hypothetical protein|nr:hypothetical protein [Anaerolineae bacterium]